MNYKENERQKSIKIRDEIFEDPGGGIYRNKEREFVLSNPKLNLWADIREDAINYFNKNKIVWWSAGNNNEPNGHLLSSQIACINHLYPARQDEDIANYIVKQIDPSFHKACQVDNGYVEFEVIGEQNYLNERSHQRGANSTSIDAVMIGEQHSGEKVLIGIEWKYTESYGSESKYIPARSNVYDPVLEQDGSPIKTKGSESLYYEPFYQLMRQTLLLWKMVENDEFNCVRFLHMHVIPLENVALRNTITSPLLDGNSMSDAWKNVLQDPNRYNVITPEELLSAIANLPGKSSYYNYLKRRYWE